jgi:putative hydrolase of HD superfamily
MISTLVELQRLKRLDRTGWVLRGLAPGAESVAAHSYGVAVTAMLLADEIRSRGAEVNVERVLRMALLHDAAEVRVGDLPRTASEYFGSELRRKAERAAFDDVISALSDGTRELYSAIHQAYELRAGLEALIVKAADLIDLLVQAMAFERAGVRGLDEFWDGVLKRDFGLAAPAAEVIKECLDQLLALRNGILADRGLVAADLSNS